MITMDLLLILLPLKLLLKFLNSQINLNQINQANQINQVKVVQEVQVENVEFPNSLKILLMLVSSLNGI